MQLKAPIFIVSSERSGTNLLRVLLDNHSQVHGPRAPQLLKTFCRVFPHYDLKVKAERDSLAEDFYRRVNHDFINWKLDSKETFQNLTESAHLIDYWDLVYAAKLNKSGKSRIVCKENDLFDFAFQLNHHYPEARFIHLYRDPRDVCASWMKVPGGFSNLSQAAQNWDKEQLKCIQARETFGLQMYSISYEELIEDTPSAMKALLEGIGLELDTACYSTDKAKSEETDWNVYWENLGKGVLTNNAKKYKSELSEDEILLVETRTIESMKVLGYERETSGTWTAPEPKAAWKFFNKMAAKFATRKYRYKKVDQKDELLKDYAKGIKVINQRRWK